MARQRGPILLSGTIGGINYYYVKGVALARAGGGGFNGEAIRKKPSMVRVRENGTEFGSCSRIKSAMRHALMPFFHINKNGDLHGRMMKLFNEIKVLDSVSIRGQRKVGVGLGTPMGELLLRSFQFTPKRNVSETLGVGGVYNPGDYSYTVQHFSIGRVSFPQGATHMEVKLGVLVFDFETQTNRLFMGVPLVIGRNFEGDGFTLGPEEVPVGEGFQLVFVGVCFYQEVGGIRYALKGEDMIGLEIVAVGKEELGGVGFLQGREGAV